MLSRQLIRTFWYRLLSVARLEDKHDQSGQSAVVVALAMVGIVGFAALIIDGGNAYAQRRRMQNAADAGVLAGVRAIADGGDDCAVLDAVNVYAVTKNGASSYVANYILSDYNEINVASGCGTVPSNAIGLRVYANATYNTYFAGILGQPTATIGANAAAGFGPLAGPQSMQPLARKCERDTIEQCFTPGDVYDIWQSDQPGNFGWLSFNSDQSAGYLSAALNPNFNLLEPGAYVDPVSGCSRLVIGCYVQGSSGISNDIVIRNALNTWLTPGMPMIIAIYDSQFLSGSNVYYHIKGFAAFELVSYSLPSGHQAVTGRFVSSYVPGQICLPPLHCFEGGVTAVGLIPPPS